MLDEVSRSTCELLACWRWQAMTGRIGDALAEIEGALVASPPPCLMDRIALLLLKAEILYLDDRNAESLQVFQENLDPFLPQLTQQLSFVIGYNRSKVAIALHLVEGIDHFYQLVDQVRLAGTELWNAKAMISAVESASVKKNYESLPTIWRELLRTYRQGCWEPFWWTCKQMAHECLRLNIPAAAAYYAILAGDSDTAKTLGRYILSTGDRLNLYPVVERVLRHAHLARQFYTACDILQSMVDVFPDDFLEAIVDRLIPRCATVPADHSQRRTVSQAWETLRAFAPRLSPNQARRAVAVAIEHPAWNAPILHENQVIIDREEMIQVVNSCASALPHEDLMPVAQRSLPLATSRMQNADYLRAVNLLCHLAERDSAVRTFLGEALYSSSVRLSFLLVQASPAFGKEFTDADWLARNCETVAHNIRLQFQRLPLDAPPENVPGHLMTYNAKVGNERLVVSIASGTELSALFAHRRHIPAAPLQCLLEAVLAMIAETENFLTNREWLISALTDVADCMTLQMADAAFTTLAPLAQGDITEPTHSMTAAEAAHPLNRNRMQMGDPGDVQGIALYALTCIEKHRPGVYGDRLIDILEPSLCSLLPPVRRFAFASCREAPHLTETLTSALLLGTRDSEPTVAAVAFDALAMRTEPPLTRPQWKLLIYSLKLAQQSPAAKLRRAAAFAVGRLLLRSSIRAITAELEGLRDMFAVDVSHSVRSSLSIPSPT